MAYVTEYGIDILSEFREEVQHRKQEGRAKRSARPVAPRNLRGSTAAGRPFRMIKINTAGKANSNPICTYPCPARKNSARVMPSTTTARLLPERLSKIIEGNTRKLADTAITRPKMPCSMRPARCPPAIAIQAVQTRVILSPVDRVVPATIDLCEPPETRQEVLNWSHRRRPTTMWTR